MRIPDYCARCDDHHAGPCPTRREIEPAFLVWLLALAAIVVLVRIFS